MARLISSLDSRLAAYRQAAGLTQQQLAEAADVSRQTIVAIERGDYSPSVVLALRLSLLLNVAVEHLFGLSRSDVAALSMRREHLLRQIAKSKARSL